MSQYVRPERIATPHGSLAQGLAGLWLPDRGGTEQIIDRSGNGRHLTIGGSGNPTTRAFNAAGVGVAASVTTFWNSTEPTLRDIPVNKNYTFAWVGSGKNRPLNGAAMGWYGADDIVFYPFDDAAGNNARVFWRTTGPNTLNSLSEPNGLPHVCAYTSFGLNEHRLFVGGASGAANTASRAGSGSFTGFFILAFPDNTVQDLADLTGNVSNMFAVWRRALTLNEHRLLARDPFAFISDRGRPTLIGWSPTIGAGSIPKFMHHYTKNLR